MNYLELINHYWTLREQGILSANEGDYYLFLIHKCNRLSWKNPFNLSNQLCCGYLGIQTKSLIKYRNKLKQSGLIDFKSGTKGTNTEYFIRFPKGCKKYTESGSVSGTLSGSESGSVSDEKPTHYIKQENNTKQNIDGHAPTAHKNSSSKKNVEPTLQDVKDYFLKTMGDSKNARSWPPDKCYNEAGQFYDHYTANGWVQNKGKPIKDWQAACRNWIRNELKGTFSAPQPKSEVGGTKQTQQQNINIDNKPQLSKLQMDINYLFERFLEDESYVTIISTETVQYDFLKKSGFINFNSDEVSSIKEKSVKHCNGHADDKMILNTMKRFGVLEFFKQQKSKGEQSIFWLE